MAGLCLTKISVFDNLSSPLSLNDLRMASLYEFTFKSEAKLLINLLRFLFSK